MIPATIPVIGDFQHKLNLAALFHARHTEMSVACTIDEAHVCGQCGVSDWPLSSCRSWFGDYFISSGDRTDCQCSGLVVNLLHVLLLLLLSSLLLHIVVAQRGVQSAEARRTLHINRRLVLAQTGWHIIVDIGTQAPSCDPSKPPRRVKIEATVSSHTRPPDSAYARGRRITPLRATLLRAYRCSVAQQTDAIDSISPPPGGGYTHDARNLSHRCQPTLGLDPALTASARPSLPYAITVAFRPATRSCDRGPPPSCGHVLRPCSPDATALLPPCRKWRPLKNEKKKMGKREKRKKERRKKVPTNRTEPNRIEWPARRPSLLLPRTFHSERLGPGPGRG